MPADGTKTKEKILKAAQRAFADHGYDGTSLRDVADIAGVRLALLHYYFGAKENLYREIFVLHYMQPLAERARLLASLDLSRPGPAALEQVVRALIEPTVAMMGKRGMKSFATLVAREVLDPNEEKRGIVKEFFDPSAELFMPALRRALPQLSPADTAWSLQFMVGVMTGVLADRTRLTRISHGIAKSGDGVEALDRMITFCTGGILAVAKAGNK